MGGAFRIDTPYRRADEGYRTLTPRPYDPDMLRDDIGSVADALRDLGAAETTAAATARTAATVLTRVGAGSARGELARAAEAAAKASDAHRRAGDHLVGTAELLRWFAERV
jgi:hypothetical protein